MRRGKNFEVSQPAKDLLTVANSEAFKMAFGDNFIRGLQTGGEFYSVIRITSVAISKRVDRAATLQAEANGLIAAASFEASFAGANSSASTHSEYNATMYQHAGSGCRPGARPPSGRHLRRLHQRVLLGLFIENQTIIADESLQHMRTRREARAGRPTMPMRKITLPHHGDESVAAVPAFAATTTAAAP